MKDLFPELARHLSSLGAAKGEWRTLRLEESAPPALAAWLPVMVPPDIYSIGDWLFQLLKAMAPPVLEATQPSMEPPDI